MLTSWDDIRTQLDDAGVVLTDEAMAFVLRHLFHSLEGAYPAPVAYLKFANTLFKTMAKDDGCVHFTNPQTGFPVFLAAYKEEKKNLAFFEVNTKRRREVVIRKRTNEVDTRKTTTTAVPGYIHCLDAGLLLNTFGSFNRQFSPIHDSLGSHCNYAWTALLPIINKQMYQLGMMNPLDILIDESGLELVPPTQDTFNLSDILTSNHSFT
jgi:hypothetical protein